MLPIFTSPQMADHHPGWPEEPARLQACIDALEGLDGLSWPEVTPATAAELAEVHDAAYVERLLASAGTPRQLDPDTRTSPGSIDAARLAAGAAREAVRAVIDGPARRALALVRPPGHHALKGAAMGFCLFNNVVLAGAAAVARGRRRVLIVDWDVHHGNGTEALVAERPEWLFFSSHQGGGGFYPGTGLRTHDNVLNVPLAPGAGDAELLAAARDVLRPAARAFAPEIVLVSAGFDAHRWDPLAELSATEAGFAALCEEVTAIADEHAAGLVLVLEGGYDLASLGASVRACAEVLLRPGSAAG